MKNISKYKVDKAILISIILFAIISIITIYSASSIVPDDTNLVMKQTIWYIAGFILAYFIMFIGNKTIYKNAWILYIIGNLLLLGLLLLADPINNSKSWFSIPGIGSFQPSEFMKIILIIILGKTIYEFNDNFPNPTIKEEFFFLLKTAIIVAIPSMLTFLQPDTGVVMIYLVITLCMLFVAGIRYRWFLLLGIILLLFVGSVVTIYFVNQDLFIKVFGTSFFLRIDRLLDWSNKSGFQLENGLNSIGSAGLFGHGFNHTPLYFPEAHTDFIFAVYASNFGLIGSLLLLVLIAFFDIKLITTALKTNANINKYIIAGIVGMLIYQQFQNISMTFGLIPITGITLPYISYGGSSLLSYMIMTGIIFNISNESLRFTN